MDSVKERILLLRERIFYACSKIGRDPSEITVVAVTKSVSFERAKEALESGILHFGENYLQEAENKNIIKLKEINPKVVLRFIGNLQKNKIKKISKIFDSVDTIDSFEKLSIFNSLLIKPEIKTGEFLIEINIGREKQKGGIMPEDLSRFVDGIKDSLDTTINGLMVIPPFDIGKKGVIKYFQEARKIFEDLQKNPWINMKTLSMGMTDDFEEAICEGSNMIRIGRGIFGER